MRSRYQTQPTLDCVPVTQVRLNVDCRDEIIPILRALQHLYSQKEALHKILDLVGRDVNRSTSRKRGRRGMDYWQILVLAAVRLGCNLNYDKLQNLAEEHRALRQIMGIGNWENKKNDRFDWRYIRDNVCLVRPETIRAINELVVAEGHRFCPDAVESLRGDAFVVETNIHYPTEANLLQDGLRKILTIGAALAVLVGSAGWRQHQHLQKRAKSLVRNINRVAKNKGKNASQRLAKAYSPLYDLTDDLLERARDLHLHALLSADETVLASGQQLQHFVKLTAKVCAYSKRRVLNGETIKNEEKIFSMFEPDTELIRRGKARQENQFGHNVLLFEDAAGFVCDYEVVANGCLEQERVVPMVKRAQKRLGGKIKNLSLDQGFHSPEVHKGLAELVQNVCVPMPGSQGEDQRETATVAFRRARRRHPGVESAIGALQSGNGLKRCRDRTRRGYERYVGLGILGRNLHILGKVLLAAESEGSQAAFTKRQRASA